MKYIVVQDMKTETKVSKNIYLFDFFFLLAYAAITLMLGNVVHAMLRVPFYLFSGVCGIFLTMKSSWNKRRRNWESLFLFIRRDREVYHPLVNGSVATEGGKKRRKEAAGDHGEEDN